MLPLLLAFVFLVLGLMIACGFGMFYGLQTSFPEPSFTEKRLHSFKKLGQQEARLHQIDVKDLSQLFKNSMYNNARLGQWIETLSFASWLKKMLIQSGNTTPVDAFMFNKMLFPIMAGVGLSFLFKVPLLFFSGFLFTGVKLILLVIMRQQRLNKLIEQLPDTLNIMTSALRAGHSFQSALGLVVNEMPKPISSELSQVATDLNLGLPIKESFAKLLENIDNLSDFQMLSTAILIQRETGGNLAEILQNLSQTIRDRFKLKRQIKSLTGQAQATGLLLGVAPLVMLIVLTLFFYSYVEPLYIYLVGNIAIGLAIFLQILGFFFIHKILSFKF